MPTPIERMPSLLAHDLAVIEARAAQLGDCRLIVVDPVSAYLGGKDDHRNAELRSVLSPLKAMAERLNVAVVLVTHLTKGAGANGKYRVMGSIAYIGACRANFLFLLDKDDPTGRRVLMLDNGCNLTPTQPGLAYVIADRGDGPAVEWLADPVAMDADTALRRMEEAEAEQRRPEEAAERRECEAWLRDYLALGRQPAKDCERDGCNAGFNRIALHRSKHRLGAVSQREGFGKDSVCYWVLPDAANRPDGSIDFTDSHRFQES
jgi:putative DNA primase/helicase